MSKMKKGYSPVTILFGVLLFTILAASAYGAYSSTNEKVSHGTVETVLKGYVEALTSAYASTPNIVTSRERGVVDGVYSTKTGLEYAVKVWNKYLEKDNQFYWDDSIGMYRSVIGDPWGGYYILLEYPYDDVNDERLDPTSDAGKNLLAFTILSTGYVDVMSTSTGTQLTIADKSPCVAVSLFGGELDTVYSTRDTQFILESKVAKY